MKRALYVFSEETLARIKNHIYPSPLYGSSRFFPAYYDWVYALMPDSWRFKKLCDLVHKFSLDIIRKRRAALKENVTRVFYYDMHFMVVSWKLMTIIVGTKGAHTQSTRR